MYEHCIRNFVIWIFLWYLFDSRFLFGYLFVSRTTTNIWNCFADFQWNHAYIHNNNQIVSPFFWWKPCEMIRSIPTNRRKGEKIQYTEEENELNKHQTNRNVNSLNPKQFIRKLKPKNSSRRATGFKKILEFF